MAYSNSALTERTGQPLFQGRFGATHLGILAHRELSALDKTIYGILAAHRNAKSGKAYPRRSTIAALADVHPDSVSRSTARLESHGFIARVHRGGTGNPTTYTFPLLDQRAAAAPEKPRPRKGPERFYSDRADSQKPPDTIERDFCEAKTHPKPLPAPEPEAEPARAERGGDDVAQIQDDIRQEPAKSAFQSIQTPDRKEPTLAFPEALALNLCAQIARTLAGIPLDDAQVLIDEMAWNARFHPVHSPGRYMRKLIGAYRAGTFTPEVAQFERRYRERIADNERSRRISEARHLEALAQGQLPDPPPAPIRERTAEETATGLAALAAMRAGLGRTRH